MQWLGTHLIAEYILPGPLSLSMILHICIQSPTRLPIFVMRGKRVKCQVLKSRWKRQQTNLKCTNDPVVVSNLHHITFFCICYCMSSFLAGTICMLAFSHTQLIYTCTHGQLDTWYQYRGYKVPMLTCIVTIQDTQRTQANPGTWWLSYSRDEWCNSISKVLKSSSVIIGEEKVDAALSCYPWLCCMDRFHSGARDEN